MAHEIMENDNMFSVREVPWHGLGNVIENAPNIDEAIILSGLNWTAGIEKMTVMREITDGQGNTVQIPIPVLDQYAVVRHDKNIVLGVVGSRYEIYQNREMWQFIDEFQRQSGIILETAGSLRNGKTTWVLAKKGEIEALNGDVVEEYFLFRNSFDGSTPISVTFTNIRVVCNNTLTMALRGARNMFNVRHTSSAENQIKEVQKALGLKYKYQEAVNEVIATLVKTPVTANRQAEILETVIFPEQNKIVQTVDENNQPVHSLAEAGERSKTIRKNRINAVLELVETGAGTDIPGVKGSMWGLYNALTEWADHSKTIKNRGRDVNEAKFENAFFGNGAKFKEDSLVELLKIAA